MADTTDTKHNTASQAETFLLQVRIPIEVNRAVRMRAAKRDLKITDAVCAALSAWAPDELAELANTPKN